MLKPIENELKDLGINKIITLSASDSMNILSKINYLTDVLAYNGLRNEREREDALRQIKWYKALLKKVQEMKIDEKM